MTGANDGHIFFVSIGEQDITNEVHS